MDTPSGEDWFLHFQDVGNAGRIIHLQPMKWVNDWPVIGTKEDRNGCGEPVLIYQKPDTGADGFIDVPEDSDEFDKEKLGLQWQWNANYQENWYQMEPERSSICLYAQIVESGIPLCDVSNLLLQKWPAPEFQITAKLEVSGLIDGDYAGMISLGGVYTGLALKVKDGRRNLVQITGEWLKANEIEVVLDHFYEDTLYLKMIVKREREVSFGYSVDGQIYQEIGNMVEATPGRWVGVKVGLFAINTMERNGGVVRADSFLFEKL